MRKVLIALAVCSIIFSTGFSYAQGSARALFIDEDSKISSSMPAKGDDAKVKNTQPSAKYMGLSYQIYEVRAEGRQQLVKKNKIFKSGDRIRLTLQSNRAGYMTVLNVGPTGEVTTLLKDKVEPYKTLNIPSKGTLKFSGPSGIESVVAMLSNKPYTGDAAVMYSECAQATPSDARNLVIDDSMSNQYSVMSTESGCKPVQGANRNLVVESYEGSNYGVLPNTVLEANAVMMLNIKLQHRNK